MAWYVNGELIDDEAVRDEARMMRPQYQEAFADMDPVEAEMQLREWARENVVERTLMRQTASTDPEPVPEEFVEEALHAARTEAGGQAGCGLRTSDEEVRQQAETSFRVQRLLERVQGSVKAPTEKEVSEFYRKNREAFRTPDLCWAKHVVKNVEETQDEATARSAIEQAETALKGGESFEDVANRFSDCAGNGGDLGWFPRGEMVEAFEEAVFALPVGSTSEIFRSDFGFHIARVFGKKPAGIRPLADVRTEVVKALMDERRQKALEEYLDDLRSKADIRQVKATA